MTLRYRDVRPGHYIVGELDVIVGNLTRRVLIIKISFKGETWFDVLWPIPFPTSLAQGLTAIPDRATLIHHWNALRKLTPPLQSFYLWARGLATD